MKQIGALYKVEDDIRRQGLEGDTLRDYRQQKAKPGREVLCREKYFAQPFFIPEGGAKYFHAPWAFEWNREQLRRLDLVPGNPLIKALGYVRFT